MAYVILNLVCVAALVGIDQAIKLWATQYLAPVEAITVIPHVVELRFVLNQGMAFSLLSGKQLFLIAATSAALLLVAYALFFRSRLLFGGLLLLAQGVRQTGAQRLALHFCLASSEFLCAGKIPVVVQPLHGLFLRVAEICRPVSAIAPVKTQRCTDIRRVIILWHLIVLYARINKRLILCARLGIALRRRISGNPCTDALHIGLHVRLARLGQELSQIRRAAFCVLIEHLLKKLVGLCPLTVFQCHLPAV